MAEVSEQVAELSAELLLRGVGELAQIAYYGAAFANDTSVVARTALIGLINSMGDQKTNKAVEKLREEGVKSGAETRQLTLEKSDIPLVEKWLKKQDTLYVAISPKKKNTLDEEKGMILFLDRDVKAVANATVLVAAAKGLMNEIPAEAFLFLHKKKDISVVDGLSIYDLEVFRELANKFGLTYASMVNGTDEKTGEVYGDNPDTYKVIASKKDQVKLAAVMQQMSWSMSGEYKDGIKEMVKERLSLRFEIQELLSKGVPEGQKTIVNEKGEQITVQNAKYLVNAKIPSQYIKLTADGFIHFKKGVEFESVSKDDPRYLEKLQNVLGEFSDAVIFDAEEWEKENLNHSNRRKNAVARKTSVFPPEHELEKENEKLRKAHKKHKEDNTIDESAWLFYKYDTEKTFSEVVEVNYNNPSEPLEETVSVHYGEAVHYSDSYKYLDVSNDEKAIDNIILSARERSMGNEEYERPVEKEATM